MNITFPTPKSGYDALRQSKTLEKALGVANALCQGGEYKAWVALDRPFVVYKDEYDANDRYIGETQYTVDLTAQPVPTCSCPDFAKHHDFCKHTLGVQLAVDMTERAEAWEAQCREHDALMLSCEDTQYGCDPFAQF